MIYLIIFGIVILFSKIANEKYKNNQNKKGHFWGFLAILTLSIFAGIRAESVGKDVQVYITPYLEWAQKFSSYSSFMKNSSIEPAFGTILFITGKYFRTPFFVLFISQFLTIGSLYIIMYQNRDKCSITLAMITYLFLFYNMSLCIMRQFIATSIFFLSTVLDKKYIKTKMMLLLSSCLFHYSIVFIIIFYYVIKFLQFRFNSKIFNFVITGMAIITLIFIPDILKIFCFDLGILNEKYYNVFLEMKLSNITDISLFECFMRAIFIIIPYILAINYSNDETYKLMSYYTFFGFIISFAATISQYLVRISYSFNLLLIYTLPYSVCFFKDKLIYKILITVACFIYWYVVYFKWNSFNTMPYMLYV